MVQNPSASPNSRVQSEKAGLGNLLCPAENFFIFNDNKSNLTEDFASISAGSYIRKGSCPVKKYSFLISAFVLMLSLSACNQQAETLPSSLDEPNQNLSANEPAGQSSANFSYQEDAAIYKDGDPGVNPNEFVNVDIDPIESQDAAVERAKNECTIAYNTTSVYYDDHADMWRIDFLTAAHSEDGTWAAAGNCQSVYMNSDGITRLIVYGE